MKRYTQFHEWMENRENRVRIGLSKKAVKELGEIMYITLPSLGSDLKEGDEAVVLESTKAATDSYMPVSGRFVAVNANLKESLDLLNDDPEGAGWLYEIETYEK